MCSYNVSLFRDLTQLKPSGLFHLSCQEFRCFSSLLTDYVDDDNINLGLNHYSYNIRSFWFCTIFLVPEIWAFSRLAAFTYIPVL